VDVALEVRSLVFTGFFSERDVLDVGRVFFTVAAAYVGDMGVRPVVYSEAPPVETRVGVLEDGGVHGKMRNDKGSGSAGGRERSSLLPRPLWSDLLLVFV